MVEKVPRWNFETQIFASGYRTVGPSQQPSGGQGANLVNHILVASIFSSFFFEIDSTKIWTLWKGLSIAFNSLYLRYYSVYLDWPFNRSVWETPCSSSAPWSRLRLCNSGGFYGWMATDFCTKINLNKYVKDISFKVISTPYTSWQVSEVTFKMLLLSVSVLPLQNNSTSYFEKLCPQCHIEMLKTILAAQHLLESCQMETNCFKTNERQHKSECWNCLTQSNQVC